MSQSVDKLSPSRSPARSVISTMPQVTPIFWIVKVLTTGFGEAASDALMRTFGVAAAVATGLLLVGALVCQFSAAEYRPAVYWSTVVMVAVFGTMAADIPSSIGAPLWATSSAYLLAVMGLFALWFHGEGTLSFASIHTRRRETFYWSAVLLTFALGTAVGDLTADVWGWGNLTSGLFFAALIVVPAGAVRWTGLNPVAGFWIAYVLTRPLGASFADWMSLPTAHGGLGLGAPLAAVIWAAPVVGVVGYLTVLRRRARPAPSSGSAAPSAPSTEQRG